MKTFNKPTQAELNRINNHFEITENQYDKHDNILVFENAIDLVEYQYQNAMFELLTELNSLSMNGSKSNVINQFVNEMDNVWNDNGKFYLINII